MATLYVAGVDLEATLGFQFTDEGEVLSGAVAIPTEIEIPTMRGALFVAPHRVPVREFTLRGYLNGATQAAVRTNLKKLVALVGEDQVTVRVADWSDVQITAKCVRFPAANYPPAQLAPPVRVEMTFRAPNPYWQDTTPQAIAFTTSAVAMPQGTAPSEPVLTTAVGAATTPMITAKDYVGGTLWTATLASLSASERYRITTAPGAMTIERWDGAVWVADEDALTAGIFPRPLPSNGTGYQTSAWPTLQATTGSWTATYNRQWR
jgi:hypothetical protein